MQQLAEQVNRRHAFIGNEECPRAETNAFCPRRSVINGNIEKIAVDDGSRRATRQRHVECRTGLHATTEIVNNLAQGQPKRRFKQPGAVHMPQQGVQFCTRAPVAGTEFVIPFCPVPQNGRHVGKSFHIVNHGRFAAKTADGGIWRAHARLAAPPFQRFQQGGFFAANVRPRPAMDVNMERKIAAGNIVAEFAVRHCLFDGKFQHVCLCGIFAADVNVAFARTDGISGNCHTFQQQMGIAVHQHPVFKHQRLTFIGIANDIAGFIGGFGNKFPFHTGGESRAAAPAQIRGGHFRHHFLRRTRQRCR